MCAIEEENSSHSNAFTLRWKIFLKWERNKENVSDTAIVSLISGVMNKQHFLLLAVCIQQIIRGKIKIYVLERILWSVH